MSKVKYNYILQLKYNGKWEKVGVYDTIDTARDIRAIFMSPSIAFDKPSDAMIVTQLLVDLEQE